MKKETEVLLTAAQDQALWTSCIKNKVNRQDVSPMCRLCGKRVGFHMTSLKFKLQNYRSLLRFYFHGVLEQLKTILIFSHEVFAKRQKGQT